MFDKKRLVLLNKFTILIIILLILILFTPFVYSKFVSKTSGNSKLETAFYILKSDYITKDISLGDIVPSEDNYIYSFSIANNDGKNRLDTKMQYSLKIITTTNLPLAYSLYVNDDTSTNIITEERIYQDEDGMYFKELKTDDVIFNFDKDEVNNYKLQVYFSPEYDSFDYQDIVEYVSVNIESKQVLSN